MTTHRPGLNHLNHHNFKRPSNLLCTCRLVVNSTSHFFFRYRFYGSVMATLLNELNSIENNLTQPSESSILNLVLYDGPKLNYSQT